MRQSRCLFRQLGVSSQGSAAPDVCGPAIASRSVVIARSTTDAQADHKDAQAEESEATFDVRPDEGTATDRVKHRAKSAAQWAKQGAGSVATAAKDAVTGTSMADETQNPAGEMQSRRSQKDPGEEKATASGGSISDMFSKVDDKRHDDRPVSERYPAMKKAASKQHRTGGPDGNTR